MDAVRLNPSDMGTAAEVYARSFFDYPMITYYWPDRQRRARYLAWYLGITLNYGLRHGQVYTTPDIAGIAVWLPPGHMHFNYWGFRQLPLRMGLRHFLTKTLPAEDLVEKSREEIMRRPHWYLWGLAVDPERQGQGIGTGLMRPGLEQADAGGVPCYLDTHDEKNVAFYQNRGFELVRTVQVPDSDLRFWCFVREPQRR